ncbi:hypothetical protein [Chamaesiphon sp.]
MKPPCPWGVGWGLGDVVSLSQDTEYLADWITQPIARSLVGNAG